MLRKQRLPIDDQYSYISILRMQPRWRQITAGCLVALTTGVLCMGCKVTTSSSTSTPSAVMIAGGGGQQGGYPGMGGGLASMMGGGSAKDGASAGVANTDPATLGTQYVKSPPPPQAVKLSADPFGRFLVADPPPPLPPPVVQVKLPWIPPAVPRASRQNPPLPPVVKKSAPPQIGRFAGWLYNSEGQVVAIFEDDNRNTRAVRVDDELTVQDEGRMRQMRVKAISPEYIVLVDLLDGTEKEVPLQGDLKGEAPNAY